MTWNDAQAWERDWHGDCLNTYGEETKQFLYAEKMGLKRLHTPKTRYAIEGDGLCVLDIGSGPSSILLKCEGIVCSACVDPISFPQWVKDRYAYAGIEIIQSKGEDIKRMGFDEAWMYNVLQHTEDPQKVVENARRAAKTIRIFEWVETGTNIGHIHNLTEAKLNEWLDGYGKVETFNGQWNCYGKGYYGIFPDEGI